MRKRGFVLLFFLPLLLLTACDSGKKTNPCIEDGVHELQYVYNEGVHWQECVREGCDYRTVNSAHTGGTATCMEAATCRECGISYGQSGNHKMQYVADGSTHTYCCAYEGCSYSEQPQPHQGGQATCVEVAKCEFCGTSYGNLGDHDMQYAYYSDTHMYVCSRVDCELAHQQPQEPHHGGTRTCAEGKKCDTCGYVYETSLNHIYIWVEDENECVRRSVCTLCNVPSAIASGTEKHHTLSADGITCEKCGVNYFDDTVEFQLSADQRSYILASAYYYRAESIVIPAEYKGLPVTEIGEMAFDGSPIKHVVLPDSVEVIGGGAFSCSDLETIVLGSGIREIGDDAFCATQIKSFTVPGSVEIVAYTVFSGCEKLEQVIIQDGVKYIDRYAFADCPNLTSLVLPNTLESMNFEALKNTPALEYNIHQGLKYLGSATNPYFALAGYAGATNMVIHPDTEFCISYALLNCEKIVSLEIGEKVRIIDEWALHGMDALETITVADGNPNYYAINNLLVDARLNMPVLGCKTSVIPDDGTFSEINLQMFDWNASIKTVYIPKGVKIVHMDFALLSGLEWVIFEADVERVIVSGDYDGCVGGKVSCYSVYHCHTEDEWKSVAIEYTINLNAPIRPTACYHDNATHSFYSETKPTTEGNYWHYVDGVPTPW